MRCKSLILGVCIIFCKEHWETFYPARWSSLCAQALSWRNDISHQWLPAGGDVEGFQDLQELMRLKWIFVGGENARVESQVQVTSIMKWYLLLCNYLYKGLWIGCLIKPWILFFSAHLIKCLLCRKSKNKKLASILEATKITLIYIRCSLLDSPLKA